MYLCGIFFLMVVDVFKITIGCLCCEYVTLTWLTFSIFFCELWIVLNLKEVCNLFPNKNHVGWFWTREFCFSKLFVQMCEFGWIAVITMETYRFPSPYGMAVLLSINIMNWLNDASKGHISVDFGRLLFCMRCVCNITVVPSYRRFRSQALPQPNHKHLEIT